MIVAAEYGISYSDYLKMDVEEISCWIRGQSKRDTGWQKLIRHMIYLVIRPNYKKGMKPTDIMKFEDDGRAKKVSTENVAQAREEVREYWRKIDEKRNGKIP